MSKDRLTNQVLKSATISLASAGQAIAGIAMLITGFDIVIWYFTFLAFFLFTSIVRGDFSYRTKELDEMEKLIFLKASKTTLNGLTYLAILLYFIFSLTVDSQNQLTFNIKRDLAIGLLGIFAAGAFIYASALFILHWYYQRVKAGSHE